MPSITYKGRRFKNKRVLSEALGVPYDVLISRIKAGWPEERWREQVGQTKGAAKPIVFQGETYPTLKELSERLGVSQPTLRKRIRDKLPEEEWGEKEEGFRDIKYKGKIYPDLQSLADELGIDRRTLRYRVLNWPEDDWARATKSGLPHSNQGIEYLGSQFLSVTALAEHLGVPLRALRGRIERNEPQEDWGRPSRRGNAVSHNGTNYPTLFDLAKKIARDNELHAGACYRKLKKALDSDLDFQEAIDFASQDQNKTEIEYLGATFESLTSLSKHLGLHIVTLRERILKQWPEEMWGHEKLPTQSPDFYFAIENPDQLSRSCSVYITQLRRFESFQKIGIAVSPTHRRDAEYGLEHYANEFDNRLQALIFEAAIHSRTLPYADFPRELVPPHRKERWHGLSELRLMDWPDLEAVVQELEAELEDEGFEVLALRYIPMSERQRTLLPEALQYLARKSFRE